MQKLHDRKNVGKIILDPSLQPKPKVILKNYRNICKLKTVTKYNNRLSDVLVKMNADWPNTVFQQSMDYISFISDTLFAKSVTHSVSTKTQQQTFLHITKAKYSQ